MIYITADPHGEFRPIKRFAEENNLSRDDIIIVLGDTGVNYFGTQRDQQPRKVIAKTPVTLFCIHGNHEMRPQSLPELYHEEEWHGGTVFVEEAVPNLLFAKDGCIFDLEGIETIVIGGAYSVDKDYRIKNEWSWFEDEQPDDATKAFVEHQLEKRRWHVDAVLSHTCPHKYEPTEAFIEGVDQSLVDKGTELWLDTIEARLTYRAWYCGHWHISKTIDRLHFMFHEIERFEV